MVNQIISYSSFLKWVVPLRVECTIKEKGCKQSLYKHGNNGKESVHCLVAQGAV